MNTRGKTSAKIAAAKKAKPKAQKKSVSAAKVVASDGGFAAKLAVWEGIVDEAVSAKTAIAARSAHGRAEALDHLPVDLFAEEDADEAAIERAHAEMNRKLNARIQALPATSDVVHELCCLRDLLNAT